MTKKLQEGTEEKCCGCCLCFTHEDTDGFGYCFLDDELRYCGQVCDDHKPDE